MDAQSLAAALPHILAAPRDDAPITGLCLRPGYGQRSHPAQITLTRAQGIPGERWTTAPWMRLPDQARQTVLRRAGPGAHGGAVADDQQRDGGIGGCLLQRLASARQRRRFGDAPGGASRQREQHGAPGEQ